MTTTGPPDLPPTPAPADRRALELRKAGMSFRQIAATPTDPANGDETPLYDTAADAFEAVSRALGSARRR